MESLSPKIVRTLIGLIQNTLGKKGDYELLLFGSFATGTAKETSDIDIAIKGKTKLPLSKWQAIENAIEDSDITRKVDVVDYHRVSKEFQKIIDTTAKRLESSPVSKS